jgi:hypothetical protein
MLIQFPKRRVFLVTSKIRTMDKVQNPSNSMSQSIVFMNVATGNDRETIVGDQPTGIVSTPAVAT